MAVTTQVICQYHIFTLNIVQIETIGSKAFEQALDACGGRLGLSFHYLGNCCIRITAIRIAAAKVDCSGDHSGTHSIIMTGKQLQRPPLPPPVYPPTTAIRIAAAKIDRSSDRSGFGTVPPKNPITYCKSVADS